MAGAGDGHINVSSWGWHDDEEGNRYRIWSCSLDGIRVCFLYLPERYAAVEALIMFKAMERWMDHND